MWPRRRRIVDRIKALLLQEALHKDEKGERRIRKITRKLLDIAEQGNLEAIKLVLDRTLGRIPREEPDEAGGVQPGRVDLLLVDTAPGLTVHVEEQRDIVEPEGRPPVLNGD